MLFQRVVGPLTAAVCLIHTALSISDPTVQIPTGAYVGRYIPEFKQDVFLGVPYADKPVRFTPAKLATGRAEVVKAAKGYGYSCPGYGSDTTNLVAAGTITINEDCLNLNVIRPSGEKSGLPVLVWIYGGGWQQGQTADPRYNMSYIIQQSVEMGKPVIGVSLNYRTGGFGFLFGKDIMNSGNTNLGLRDQRLALEWIQQNIKAFGGDPRKVTVWGEPSSNPAELCYNTTDTLECLRAVPYDKIYTAMDAGYEWFAVVDGQFVTQWPVKNIKEKKFLKVPILIGSNTDEGISFGVAGVNTDAQAIEQLSKSKRWVVTPFQAENILALYPNDPVVGSPYGTGSTTWPSLGLQYKRYSSIAGDLTMDAPRRLMATAYAASEKVYSFRFDTPMKNSTTKIGVGHFSEIPHVFSNPDPTTLTPLGNDPSHLALGHLMARMWVSFAADLNPNNHNVKGIAEWPAYKQSSPKNFVFRNDTSYVEDDTYRKEGMDYINTILR
ncbi:hypothetical protein Q9L58_005821 [Maublancomyces gigas]|uniref:Carboxylesterase type B domain-containing protein n=1 Tax=Discina gigas TaxID=1032678 RepID=A0ABR3GH59_9PEZI